MARYRNKAPPHLAPPEPKTQGVRIPTDRERIINNRRVSYMEGVEAITGKELGEGEEQVKYVPVSEEDRKQSMVPWDILEEGATEAY